MRSALTFLCALVVTGCGVALDFDPPDPDLGVADLGGVGADAGTPDASHPDLGPDAQTGCRNDSQCDDGLFCNGQEACTAGHCVSGTHPLCDPPAVSCVTNTCDETLRGCVLHADATRCAAGQICDRSAGCIAPPTCMFDTDCRSSDRCLVGRCGAGTCHFTPIVCTDANPTDCVVPQCDPASGACVPTPIDSLCADAFGCTVDTCASDGGCRHMTNDSFCDFDGAACTVDVCDPTGGCADPTTGCATSIDNTVCSDWFATSGLPGSVDGCAVPRCFPPAAIDPTVGCAVTPFCGGPGEMCVPSVTGMPTVCGPRLTRPCSAGAACDDLNPCNGVETCDPTAHVCMPGTPPCGTATGTLCFGTLTGGALCGVPATSLCP